MEPANARCRRLVTLLLRILRCKPSIGEPFEGGELEVGGLRQGTLDNIRACSRDRPQAVPSPSPRSWLPDRLVIAGHNGNCRNSERLAPVRRPDRYAAHGRFDLAGQLDGSGTGGLDGVSGTLHLVICCARRPRFVGRHPFGDTVGEPFSDRYRLSIEIGEGLNDGFDAVEG
jgi:hypothetical protein